MHDLGWLRHWRPRFLMSQLDIRVAVCLFSLCIESIGLTCVPIARQSPGMTAIIQLYPASQVERPLSCDAGSSCPECGCW